MQSSVRGASAATEQDLLLLLTLTLGRLKMI